MLEIHDHLLELLPSKVTIRYFEFVLQLEQYFPKCVCPPDAFKTQYVPLEKMFMLYAYLQLFHKLFE